MSSEDFNILIQCMDQCTCLMHDCEGVNAKFKKLYKERKKYLIELNNYKLKEKVI